MRHALPCLAEDEDSMKIFKLLSIVVGIFVLLWVGFRVGQSRTPQHTFAESSESGRTQVANWSNIKVVGEPPNVKILPVVPEGDVPGTYLKAFLAAYGDFRKIPDLPEHKKNLENYTIYIGLSPDGKNYYVTFTPKYVPPKYGVTDVTKDGGMGRRVGYTIRLQNFSIAKRSSTP